MKTLNILDLPVPKQIAVLKEACNKKGYWFPSTSTDGDVFLFGIRNKNRDQKPDAFDDVVGVLVPISGQYRLSFYEATTDPGKLELLDPSFAEAKRNGTAIMKEGQYRGAYRLGYHGSGKWRHRALIQVRAITIYRDNNRNDTLDIHPLNTTEGLYGINIHGAALWKSIESIGRYSAGCQVVNSNYEDFITNVELQVAAGLGHTFTYTLFDEVYIDEIIKILKEAEAHKKENIAGLDKPDKQDKINGYNSKRDTI